jgi:2-polyprenyl-3-methyl-5-hydroxy-6-metoxy-1,4-benzoquinol methylase
LLSSLARQNLPDAEFRQGNGEALPYESGSVDVAIATGIMHHADHPDRVIAVCLSQIKSGRIGDANRPEWSGE